jgi:hypothetical protein
VLEGAKVDMQVAEIGLDGIGKRVGEALMKRE